MEPEKFEKEFQFEAGNNGSVGIIKLSGILTIQDAVALKETLLDALSKADTCLLDASLVSQFDLSSIQILYATYKSAIAKNKIFDLSGECPITLKDAVAEAGFDRVKWLCFGKD